MIIKDNKESTIELMKTFQINLMQAKLVIKVIFGQTKLEAFRSVEKWIAQCFNKPSELEMKMEALNELIDGFGVEAVNHESNWDRYWGNAIALYVNTGDTYSPTILYSIEDKQFELTTWGDFYESFEHGLETD